MLNRQSNTGCTGWQCRSAKHHGLADDISLHTTTEVRLPSSATTRRHIAGAAAGQMRASAAVTARTTACSSSARWGASDSLGAAAATWCSARMPAQYQGYGWKGLVLDPICAVLQILSKAHPLGAIKQCVRVGSQ